MLRKLLIAVVAVIVVIGTALALLPLVLDKDQLVEVAAGKLKEETGATLAVDGGVDLSFFPVLGVALKDASITMPENTEPDLAIGALQIGVRLMPLLSGEIAIDTIALDEAYVRIVATEDPEKIDTSKFNDAELNAFYAKQRKNREAAGQAAGAEAALAVPLALNVSSLSISNTRLEMIDPAADEPTLVDLKSLKAKGLNLSGDAIPITAELVLPGDQAITITLDGSLRIAQESQTANLDVLNVTVSGATAQDIQVAASGPVNLQRQSADLDIELVLGETKGSGNVRYASFESPQIDADLKLNLFDPALLALAGPEAAAEAETTDADSSSDTLPLDALRSIDTRAALGIEQARFGGHNIENLQVKLRAVEGIIKIKTLTGQLHDGQLNATASFNGKHNTATLDTTGTFNGLNIAKTVQAAKAAAPIRGTASLKWQLSSRGSSTDALIEGLTGPIKMTTQEVVLEGTNVEHMLCQGVALANQKKLTNQFPTDTTFSTLGADIQLADGKAVLQPLRAELPRLALNGKGNYNLLTSDLNATFKARLSPELEELDPACNVSKRLTAIDWPVNCRGNASEDPADWCKVDAEKILRDLTINEGRKKIEKKAGKFFNKFLGGKNKEE